ncbi:hypothetical protein JG688_00014620 [Phytophthora aleatoria]|uniref:Uncharacterized protein n=1 Tax=Phytophthora aleatoria TaxID=2496075 RepID=A0A8J5IWS2_9STRA|nr:hypothetical protein JG688_00014620 [Phytophthora aleatoria]
MKRVSTVLVIFAGGAGISLYIAPMEKLFQVLKHKSAVFINVHMVYAGIVTYGILITNWFIVFINILFITNDRNALQNDRNALQVDDDERQISVTIEQAPPLEAESSKKSLKSLSSPGDTGGGSQVDGIHLSANLIGNLTGQRASVNFVNT